MKRNTVRDIQKIYEKGNKISCLSLYDACMARFADDSGSDVLLVGDSLGMTVLGYETTVPVTLEDCLRHTAAVVRGSAKALVVGDLPFATYQPSIEMAMKNAAKFLHEAGAQAVKLEGGVEMAPTVKALVRIGIPVMGHIGILPQNVNVEGYRVKGRTDEEEAGLLKDALALQEAGVFSLVLEGIQKDAAARITEALKIPTVGIGAGKGCSGQIQVAHDILGLMENATPKHARKYAMLAEQIRNAFKSYNNDVRDLQFPGEENSFK